MSASTGAPHAGRRRILLMRHGHVDYFTHQANGGSPNDVLLTETGRAQAAAAAEALSEVPFDLAVCSGLPRTVETASIVLSRQAAAPQLAHNDAFEELRGGWVNAATRAELMAKLAYAFEAADQPGASFLEGGERFDQAYARSTQALQTLLTRSDWRRALLVAHEGINRLLLGWASGGGLGAIKAFEQDLGCVNILDFDMTPAVEGEGLQIERVIIKAINITPYDYLKHGMTRTSLEPLFDVE